MNEKIRGLTIKLIVANSKMEKAIRHLKELKTLTRITQQNLINEHREAEQIEKQLQLECVLYDAETAQLTKI